MSNTTSQVVLSNNLLAVVSALTVTISGVSVPASQFDTAKPYVDRARQINTTPATLNVSGYEVGLKYLEPVITAGGYEFPLSDFDKVVAAIEEARKPKAVTVEVLPGVVATVTANGITVNGQTVPADVLGKLNAAVEEVNS